jgi:hypothetical protein
MQVVGVKIEADGNQIIVTMPGTTYRGILVLHALEDDEPAARGLDAVVENPEL